MDIKKFLQKALGSEGYYCVFAVAPHKEYPIQKFYPSIDQLLDTAENLTDEGYNVWFALATFKEPNTRKAHNANQLNSLFLDLDCGPNKDYPDKQAALKALQKFCVKLSLPKPQLVDSGNGIHVYWMLEEAVGPASWGPVAERLKYKCAELGLYADPTVTADAARVLRMPGSNNLKYSPSSPVLLLGKEFPAPVSFDRFSDLIGGPLIPAPTRVTPNIASSITDVLAGNVAKSFKEIIRKTRKDIGCAQLRHVITSPSTCSEPLWRAGLSIVKFCEDGGLKGAHKISSGYDGYDAAETEDKYNLIPAPQLCATFDAERPNICRKCPNWGKIKSPISLGMQIIEATEADNIVEAPAMDLPNAPVSKYVIPPYPRPYFRGVNGGIYIRVAADDDDEVEERVIYHNDLYVTRRLRDVELGEALVMRLHLPRDGVREFTVPLTAIGAREEFRKHMAMQGIAIAKIDLLMQYILTWVNELQGTTMADEAHRQFGWTSEESTSFVLGDREIFADHMEVNPPAIPTKDLFKEFVPKGTLEDWRTTVNFYNRPGLELHQFVTCTGFGSPLMQFMPISCAGLHLHSKASGVGKTTAMFASTSIWGNPDGLILHKEDTQNGRMNRGEVYRNIPLCMDELTNATGRELSELAYQLTGGRQKIRLTSGANTERARGGPWRMLSVSTGNTSFVGRIAMFKTLPKAEAQRILECPVARIEFDTKSETDAFSAALNSNYGHAGPIYIQYVMRNLEQVKKLLADVQARVDKSARLTAENRFWSAYVTATICGLIIAKRCGLIDYDADKVYKWAIKLLEANKKGSVDMGGDADEVINDYISEHYGSVLWIKSWVDNRGGAENNNGLDSLVIPDAVPKGKLVARYETDVKKLYLLPKPFRAWCAEQQLNADETIAELMSTMNGKKAKKRIGKGTKLNLPATNVIVLDCDLNDVEE